MGDIASIGEMIHAHVADSHIPNRLNSRERTQRDLDLPIANIGIMRIDSDHRSTVPPSDVLGLKSHGWYRYPCAQFHNYQSSAVGEKLCYPLLVALRLAHRSIP